MNQEQYFIGNDIIDLEHSILFELIGKLDKSILDPNEIIYELNDYAKKHFSVEEEIMNVYDYPALDEHIKCHDEYFRKIDEFIQNDVGIGELKKFLNQWLLQHINVIDRDYQIYLDSLGLNFTVAD